MRAAKKTAAGAALVFFFFLPALGAYAAGRADSSRWNVPKLEVTTIDARSRLVRFDWSAVDYPDDYRFGLYRLDRATRTNVFLKEIVKTETQFADTGLNPPLYNYFYLVECVPATELIQERKDIRAPSDREIAQQTISAYYIDTRNPQYWVDEDTPARAERLEPDASPRPPPGRRAAAEPPPNDGIYVGLISFSGSVKEITKDPVLLPLDPAGRQELMDKLNVNYAQSSDFGSALYYATHLALANLSELQRSGGLPRNVEHVGIITFTDGLDTSSTDSGFTPLEGKDFRPQSGRTPDDYKEYLAQELKNRLIAGTKINAWTIGVEGKNTKNNWTFNQLLREISTDDNHYAQLGDINQLESNLSALADVLNIYTSIVNLSFTTPAYPVGTTVRLTFDNDVADPNKAKYWIEGDVEWVNGKYALANLCSNGIRLGDGANVLGIRTARGIEYTIRMNDDFYRENLRQWQLPPDTQDLGANWVSISDFYAEKSLDIARARKSSLIYLVLDANPSLKPGEINSIRGAAQSFIEKLYLSAGSGIRLKPLGGVPRQSLAREGAVSTPPAAQKPPVAEPPAPAVSAAPVRRPRAPRPEAEAAAPRAAVPPPAAPAPYYRSAAPPMPEPAAAPAPDETPLHLPPPPLIQARPLVENTIQITTQNAPVAEAAPPRAFPAPARNVPPAVSITVRTPESGPEAARAVRVYAPPPERAESVFRGPPLKAPRYTEPEKGFWIQLGSYIELIRAQRAAQPLLAGGLANLEIFAKEINGSMYYRVKMGPYRSRAEADSALFRLGQKNMPVSEGFVVAE